MYVSSASTSRPWSSPRALGCALVSSLLVTACGGSSGGSGQSGTPGEEVTKPGGGLFIVDPNQSGGAANLQIAQVTWGRLVDIHEIDANGDLVSTPVYTDFVIEPNLLITGASYVLDRNPVTQRERLVIQARKTGVTDTLAFDELLAAASDALSPVASKNDDGSSSPPFTSVPRNATVVLRFNDCLDDSATGEQKLVENVRVVTGYTPATPYSARVIFDPNYGALVGGAFHSTRVLVDMTTSETEAAALPTTQDVNAIGLPASLTTSNQPNVTIRIPTRLDAGSSQLSLLTTLSGAPLDPNGNGPADPTIPTLDVVRAFRSGNSNNASNGFLSDDLKPLAVGAWAVDVTAAAADPAGSAGLDFLVDLTFSTTCLVEPSEGDVIRVGDEFLVVSEDGALVGSDVADLKVRSVASVGSAIDLLGSGTFETPFLNTLALAEGCWVNFLPTPGLPPAGEVSTSAQIQVRFSEPMDPATLSPFEGFLVVEGAAGGSSTVRASNLVVGDVLPNADLTQFSYSPRRPFPHSAGLSTDLHIELRGATDLAGNALRFDLPFIDFELDPLEASQLNGALTLRFNTALLDEYAPSGGAPDNFIDIRGQYFHDSTRGVLLARPVAFTGWPVDRTNPVPQNMIPLPAGVFTPLTPLGAKIQMLWRYCDMGWDLNDETKFNLDVFGLSWSPVGGLVVADFYDQLEIRLGHSRFLPDEAIDPMTGLPFFPNSGLPGAPALFEGNFLGGSNPKIVHNRALGYTVNPSDLFISTTNTAMMPYPLNRGQSPIQTYTFRDTTIETLGADGDQNQPGAPLQVESDVGVPDSTPTYDALEVPSFGLPLLIELKCFEASRGLGLNLFDVSIANALATTPNFRSYSAGGIDTTGGRQIVLPDSEDIPQGGYNANSTPPGRRTTTTADSVFYLGQLDTVVRVSRVHSVWLDSGSLVSPTWQTPIVEPANSAQPLGTQVQLDFRSATGFSAAGNQPFNGAALDAFGDTNSNAPQPQNLTDWSSSVTIGNGQRYLQLRMTFVNNIVTSTSPELNVLSLPFLK